MGGGYPSGYSWNFWGSGPYIAAHVLNQWPGRVVFIGDDVGQFVMSGASLIADKSLSDPVRDAYIYYRHGKPHCSWDPLTVLYAAEGESGLFISQSDEGYNHIEPNGSNYWISRRDEDMQQYLRLKVSNETAASKVDSLFLRGARSRTKRNTASM